MNFYNNIYFNYYYPTNTNTSEAILTNSSLTLDIQYCQCVRCVLKGTFCNFPAESEPMTGPPSDSARLRDLLTKERSDEANQTDISAADSKDRILKTLLNQEDDRTATSASGSGGGSKPGSDMLLKVRSNSFIFFFIYCLCQWSQVDIWEYTMII